MCYNVMATDDDLVENTEVLVLNVVALSEGDMVMFPNGSEAVRIYIVDNDGMWLLCIWPVSSFVHRPSSPIFPFATSPSIIMYVGGRK